MSFIEMVVHIRESKVVKKVLLVCPNPFRMTPMLVPSFAAVSGMCLKEERRAARQNEWSKFCAVGLLCRL